MKIMKTARYIESATRGRFKYKCDSCGEESFLTSRERSSASRPRCSFCGSTWLEPVTDYSQNNLKNVRDEFKRNIEMDKQKMNYELV